MSQLTNTELKARRKNAVSDGVITMFDDVFAERASNSEVWDVEGKRYLDFSGGIGTLNTGHMHPEVLKAVQTQIGKFSHTAFQILGYRAYIELAEKLNRIAPGSTPKKSVLFTTGAESVENAVKIARMYTKRPGIITFRGGFHGRTALTMAMTGKVMPYKKAIGSLPGDIYHIPMPVAHHHVSEADSLAALENLFMADIEADRVAALIMEPVMGEGGFYFPTQSFIDKLYAICQKHGILFVSDEVQSGFGRTGKWFAIEHYGIEPDLITSAKSLAGGFPLSAVIGKAHIMDAPHPGALGGTFGGNPVSCVAALAVIEVMEKEGLLARSVQIGEIITSRMKKISAESYGKSVSHIRGLGGMTAFEFLSADGKPDADKTKLFVRTCREQGLIILPCGIYSNTVRILVPLTVSDTHLNEGLNIIDSVIRRLSGETA